MFSIHSYIGSYAKGKKLQKDAPCNSANRRGAHQLKAQFFLKKTSGMKLEPQNLGPMLRPMVRRELRDRPIALALADRG